MQSQSVQNCEILSTLRTTNDKDDMFELVAECPVLQYDIKKKFDTYRAKAKLIEADCKEAKEVIQRLKHEISLSRDIERVQRLQLSTVLGRLKVLEEKQKLFCIISEKQKNNDKALQKQEEQLANLCSVIQELKPKCEAVINRIMAESDSDKQNASYLESSLKEKNALLHLVKSEVETIAKEKNDLIHLYEPEIERLKEEIKAQESKISEIRVNYNVKIGSYRKQVKNYEKIIHEMERERRSILGDYETGPKLENDKLELSQMTDSGNTKEFPYPDSTATCSSDERENISSPSKYLDTIQSSSIMCDTFSKTTREISPIGSSTMNEPSLGWKIPSKTCQHGLRRKLPLDFVDRKSKPQKTELSSTKKRLYSENSNYYFT